MSAKSVQLCSTLCDPMDCNRPGSSVCGILQARILEWIAMPSSGGLLDPGVKPPLKNLSLAGRFFTTGVTWEAQKCDCWWMSDMIQCMMSDGDVSLGTTQDEMAGWHHWLDGREFEWTPGVGDGQRGLACCDSWGRKESDTTEQLNWTELNTILKYYGRKRVKFSNEL